jgi:molybdate transport system ATP-binding protein
MTDRASNSAADAEPVVSDTLLVRVNHSPSEQSSFRLNVDLSLPSTGVTMIYGASGSGKTTLLRCIAGLERAKHAEIKIGRSVWQSSDFFLPTHKRSLGFVFQEASLFPFMTAEKNLAFACGKKSNAAAKNFFDEVVALMGIQRQLPQQASQLSGGERQRVAIARALLLKPSVLLLDEPLASLDKNRREEILPYLDKLQTHTKIPILYVTHSDDEVLRLATHLVVLEEGACAAAGSVEDVVADLNLPFSNFSDRSAVFSARVSKRETSWGLLLAEFDGGALWLADNSKELGGSIRLRIKASDVSIALTDHHDSSILNRLPASVIAIESEASSSMSLVRLQVGQTILLARISNWSLQRLNLQVGLAVWAQLKAVAIAR